MSLICSCYVAVYKCESRRLINEVPPFSKHTFRSKNTKSMFSKHTFRPKRHKKYVLKTYFSVKKAKMYMYGLACVRRWTDGHADGVLKINFHRGFLKTSLKQGKMHFLPHFALFSENRDESLKNSFSLRFSENRPK